MPPLPHPARVALALLIGTAGALVFRALALPLPWMLGAMVFVLIAALARAPIRGPDRLRPALVSVTGVLLGSGFRPDLLGALGAWAVSLAALMAYLAISAAVAVPWYMRFRGFDRMTAYFAAMPGGIIEMTMLARAFGADDRRVVLAHMARIVVTIALVGLWFRVIKGHAVGANPGGPGIAELSPYDAAVLLLCAVLGALAGLRLKLPAPTLMGPMAFSGIAHLTGITASAPPAELVILVQLLLGTVLGARFIGIRPHEVAVALLQSAVATLFCMALALGFAMGLSRITSLTADQIILGFAPGGLPEMSLVAIAIHADLAFVALHHLVRVVTVISVAPLVARGLRRRG